MGKVKSQWLEYLSEVLQLTEVELLDYTFTELTNMLKVYEDSLEAKLKEQDEYYEMLSNQIGWDVEVDEDSGRLFIVNTDIGGIA
tara:strand:+ start:742 stop:996 length:255 start_codon:yes stop_codon:yes gene_type:complete